MSGHYVALPESAQAAVAERWRIFCYSHPLTNEPEAIFEGGLLAGFRLATYMGNELAQVTPCLRLWIDLLERAAEAERRAPSGDREVNEQSHLPHREPIGFCQNRNCSGLSGRNAPVHNCAQVERDCLELHQALVDAISRAHAANASHCLPIFCDDLVGVLDRTSRPGGLS